MSCNTCNPSRCACRPRRRGRRARFFGAIESTCTGKYKGLVRNGVGGHLDKPCANAADIQLYCNQADADAWMVTADDLFNKVRSAWNQTGGGGFRIPTPVREYITALQRDYCEADDKGVCTKFKLPGSSWWDVAANSAASVTIAKWCNRAACALELLDQVRGGGGLPVEVPQENDPILPGGWGSLPLLAGAALLLLVVMRR